MITAPFNFVPLSEKVFFPDWAESVSHDIPFEDGESGIIDIAMTAKSPIFVRDGVKDGELKLSRAAIAGIFGGSITHWDDKEIMVQNAGLKLPHEPITVAVRADK